MVEELSSKARATEKFHEIAQKLTRRKEAKAEKQTSPLSAIGPILEKLRLKR
jgi:pilus assembly protein CpaE